MQIFKLGIGLEWSEATSVAFTPKYTNKKTNKATQNQQKQPYWNVKWVIKDGHLRLASPWRCAMLKWDISPRKGERNFKEDAKPWERFNQIRRSIFKFIIRKNSPHDAKIRKGNRSWWSKTVNNCRLLYDKGCSHFPLSRLHCSCTSMCKWRQLSYPVCFPTHADQRKHPPTKPA